MKHQLQTLLNKNQAAAFCCMITLNIQILPDYSTSSRLFSALQASCSSGVFWLNWLRNCCLRWAHLSVKHIWTQVQDDVSTEWPRVKPCSVVLCRSVWAHALTHRLLKVVPGLFCGSVLTRVVDHHVSKDVGHLVFQLKRKEKRNHHKHRV